MDQYSKKDGKRIKRNAGGESPAEELQRLERESEASIYCFPEKKFSNQMKLVVEPYLKSICESGYRDGLYFEFYPRKEFIGTIVICYGFTESALKYHELVYYFYWQGYQVAVQDHRGHGKSLRENDDVGIVHIEQFSQYVEDLHGFVRQVVRPREEGKPLYLYAHSMGGCIGALYLERYPKEFSKAVLNAPMLGIVIGKCPLWAAEILCTFKVWMGNGKKRLFFHSEFQPDEPFTSCGTDSEARYRYYLQQRRDNLDYQTSSASYQWGKEAIRAGKRALRNREMRRVTTPVLLIQAGKDKVVREKEQFRFINGIKNGTLLRMPDSSHEIYRGEDAVISKYLEEIFDFFRV